MTTSDPSQITPSGEHEPAEAVPRRKPPQLTWQSFAERRIQEAQQNGEFAELPGLGKPIPGIDQPLDENWWVKKKLRDENLSVLPPTLEARRAIERVRQELLWLSNEGAVRKRIHALNEMIREAIYSTTVGPASGVQLIDVDAEVETWREARKHTGADSEYKSSLEIDTLCTNRRDR